MEGHELPIRCCTTLAQKPPKDYEDKLISFQRFIIGKRKQHDFELGHIGNADQTPLTFDIVTNSTVEEKGIKSVPVLTTRHDKDRFTVMLACLGDRTKLPPYVVFKWKTLWKKMTFPHGLVVRCQEKGWMNEELVKDWLNTVWSKVGDLSRRKLMLVWDSFCAHLSAPIRRTLQSLNTECAIIPGGMTGILQPLDVCINKPFKDRLRVKWQEWMITEHTLTASGCTRKADLNVICGWIKDAWNDIPTEMIETSFRKCCITNAINGTEDDDIWEEETDPFDDFNDEFDDELYYADTHEKEQAGLADTFDEIFRNFYDEDFFGF